MLKKLIRFPIQIILFFTFLATLSLGLAQFQFVKDIIKDILLSNLSKNLNAKIFLGKLTGNLITQVEIIGVVVKVDEDYILAADRAVLKLNPLTLLNNNLVLNEFILYNPIINFHKYNDGSWNFENIVKKKDREEKEKSDWILNLSGIEIKNGILNIDSRLPAKNDNLNDEYFQFNHFSLKELDLALSFKLTPELKYLDVGHSSFKIDNKHILKDFSGRFRLTRNEVKIDTLNIEYNNSLIKLSTYLKNINYEEDTLSLSYLKEKPLELNLNAENINFDDISYYIPALSFLNGNVKLKLLAKGNLEDLDLKSLDLETENSKFILNGDIRNIHSLKDLYFKINMQKSVLLSKDINTYLASLNLPDFSNYGRNEIDMVYEGKPLNFNSSINMKGDIGAVKGDISLDMEPQIPEYLINLQAENLNFRGILGPEFDTKINLIAKGKGNGFRIDDVNADFDIKIDSSKFINQIIDKSRITTTITNKHVNTIFALTGNGTQIGLNTEFDFNKNSNQYYNLNLSLSNLDLAKFLPNPKYTTNLNLSSNVQGNNLDINSTSCQMKLFCFSSNIGAYDFGDINILLNLDQSNSSNKFISLYSNIADFDVRGQFNLVSFVPLISERIFLLKENASRLLTFPEKILLEDKNNLTNNKIFNSSENNETVKSTDSIDIHYNIICKNLSPLKSLINFRDINTDLNLEGELIYNANFINTNGKLSINNLFYLSNQYNILIQDAHCNFSISSLNVSDPLLNLKSEIQFIAPSIYYGQTHLNSSSLLIRSNRNVTKVNLKTNIDSTSDIFLCSSIDLSDSVYVLAFDTLNIGYNHYNWRNHEKIICLFRNDEFEIQSFELTHNNEIIYLQGNINKSGEQNLNLIVSHLLIQNLISLFSFSPVPESSLLSGELNLIFEVFGTGQNPMINIKFRIDSLLMNNKYAGKLLGEVHYEDRIAYNNIQFKSSESISGKKSDLLLIGTIPINLSTNNQGKIFPDEEEIDLYLVTDKFPMKMVSLMFPELENFNGTTDVNIHFYGTGTEPTLDGYLILNKSTFTFNPNRIEYITFGKFNIEENELKVNLSILNHVADRKDGKVDIDGNISLENFSIKDMNFIVSGQIQALQTKSKKSNKELYGDLFIAIGENGLVYNYNPLKNKIAQLTGSVILKEGNLFFPSPGSESYYDVNSSNFKYTIIDDTTKISSDSTKIKRELFRKEFEKQIESESKILRSSSSFGNIDYKIDIKTLGDLKVEMVFNSILNEALVGEFGGNISLIKEKNTSALYGSLKIGEKSYYKFAGKKFDASGKISFTGAVDNPELDIKATYQGTHKSRENLGKEEKVLITLTITGTKEKPYLKFDLSVNDNPRTQGDVESDIFAFILSGSFNDELTSDQKQNIALNYNFGSSFYSIGSGVISGKLTEFFKNEFEFIKSVEADYSGGDLTKTNLKVSGEIGKTALFHLGGKVFNDVGNTNVTLELPIGKFLNNELLRNLTLEIYRTTSENNKTVESKEIPFYGSRILYKINF